MRGQSVAAALGASGVERGDLGAQMPHRQLLAACRPFEMGEPQRDQAMIPLIARLIFQQLRHTVGTDPRRQARRGERQQGRQRVARRRRRHGMLRQRARQAHGFDAEFRLHQGLAGRRRIALVEHQVERGAHQFGALGQRLGRRRLDRHAGLFELPAGAHQALGNGRGLAQQARGDLRHGETAHRFQRKGDAHLWREQRMADREQQRQLIVAQLAIEVAVALGRARLERQQLIDQRQPARLVAQQVEGAIAWRRRPATLPAWPARP